MNSINANEVLMPSLVSSDVFNRTGRKDIFGNEMFNLYDRNDKELSLCPTHEELFAYLARYKIMSYKDLHFSLYQISNKYRDEVHPEFGIIRKKEFIMADAYSFDSDDGGLDISYDKMFQAFKNIFNRLGLDTIIVRSDASSMKGVSSEEFQVVSEYGDNEVVKCDNCSYSSNIEEAECKVSKSVSDEKLRSINLVHTPDVKTIKDLADYMKVDASRIIKSIVCKIDGEYKMFLLCGEAKLNIDKVKKLFKSDNIEIPSNYELESIGTSVGFIGPVKSTMEIIADREVKYMVNAICGANKKDYHYANVNPGRDFKINKYSDIKLFDNNNVCPNCKSKCSFLKGIEVGHIFKLGTTYSREYNLKYLDEKNESNLVQMGSYGIGIDRVMGAIVEAHHDDKGIIWPVNVSPFKVCIVVANVNDSEAYKYAKNLYEKLNELNIDVLLDDRKESIGIKFADMDLIGIPYRIVVGKLLSENKVEYKKRWEEKPDYIDSKEILETLLFDLKND